LLNFDGREGLALLGSDTQEYIIQASDVANAMQQAND
jgi:hypothetical protein